MESSRAISVEYVNSTVILIRICLRCMWPNYCISDHISGGCEGVRVGWLRIQENVPDYFWGRKKDVL